MKEPDKIEEEQLYVFLPGICPVCHGQKKNSEGEDCFNCKGKVK